MCICVDTFTCGMRSISDPVCGAKTCPLVICIPNIYSMSQIILLVKTCTYIIFLFRCLLMIH